MKFFSIVFLLFAILVLFASAETENSESTAEDVCRQPLLRGRCRALIPKFYYDISAGECKSFGYGGCGGNDNNFNTQKECEDKCKGVKPAED